MNYHVYYDTLNELVRVYTKEQPAPLPGVSLGVLSFEGTLPHSTFKTWLTTRLRSIGISPMDAVEILYL